jgi:putative transposase
MKRAALQHDPPATDTISYAGYRFPPDVIGSAVWLLYRFPLSLRMVEELLAARSIDLSYETVRRWSVKFCLSLPSSLHARNRTEGRDDQRGNPDCGQGGATSQDGDVSRGPHA